MEVKINLLTNKSKVIKYLTRKEVWVHGFLRYNQLKKMISHIVSVVICTCLKIQIHHVLKIKL